MSRLNTFVAPKPSRLMSALMTPVNRIFMLKGIPLLRDVPLLNKVAPFRGLANVRQIDFPASDRARLEAVVGQGKATFFTPNHPEFFTDWMIDKEILSRVAPKATSWATNGVVNGLGRVVQKFWLANGLIAQIPGNSEAAKEFSINWSLTGNGVLLHPEGAVGWHSDHVDHLMPGAAQMAMEALRRGREANPAFEAWLAPVIWKLSFQHDVEAGLLKECAYVEKKLKIERSPAATLPERVFDIYKTVLRRDAERFDLQVAEMPTFSQWHYELLRQLCAKLGDEGAVNGGAFDGEAVLRRARRELRSMDKVDKAAHAEKRKLWKGLSDSLANGLRLAGSWAFSDETITQEEIAEHIKRLRNDYCRGTMRDTLNAFVPQPAGPRTAHIRVPEPIAVHEFAGSAEELTHELHRRLQDAIDAVNLEPAIAARFIRYPNPFYPGLPDVWAAYADAPRASRVASAG